MLQRLTCSGPGNHLGCLAVSELQCAGRQKEAGGNELAVAQLIAQGFSEEASRQVRTSGFVPGAVNSISSGAGADAHGLQRR